MIALQDQAQTQTERYITACARRKARWVGQQRYLDGLALATCENEAEERGWWSMFYAATYAEYSADAMRRGVDPIAADELPY